jgi:hypothetical protein
MRNKKRMKTAFSSIGIYERPETRGSWLAIRPLAVWLRRRCRGVGFEPGPRPYLLSQIIYHRALRFFCGD